MLRELLGIELGWDDLAEFQHGADNRVYIIRIILFH